MDDGTPDVEAKAMFDDAAAELGTLQERLAKVEKIQVMLDQAGENVSPTYSCGQGAQPRRLIGPTQMPLSAQLAAFSAVVLPSTACWRLGVLWRSLVSLLCASDQPDG